MRQKHDIGNRIIDKIMMEVYGIDAQQYYNLNSDYRNLLFSNYYNMLTKQDKKNDENEKPKILRILKRR